ncbi:MAG: hypothetical protein JW889_10955 [Verrucomicrobia bacterium]|nr:hypothetical protein [Verrucomicrobiota bacterium]
MNGIPRGVEVLVKKASVDPVFRDLLLTKRAAAAATIGLKLEPSEIVMVNAVPAAQLEAIIARTTVHPRQRPAFLGRVAAVMIVALGASTVGCGKNDDLPDKGIRPDRPEESEAALSTSSDGLDDAHSAAVPEVTESTRGRAAAMPETIEQLLHPEKGRVIILGTRPDRLIEIPERSAVSQEFDDFLSGLETEQPSVSPGLVGEPGGPLDPFRIAPTDVRPNEETQSGPDGPPAGDEQ